MSARIGGNATIRIGNGPPIPVKSWQVRTAWGVPQGPVSVEHLDGRSSNYRIADQGVGVPVILSNGNGSTWTFHTQDAVAVVMTPEDAFLQAICEAPDDDFPRLQFADWLEERGDWRAGLIRGQIQHGWSRSDLNIGAYLIVTTGRDTVGLLGVGAATISRGFVERVELTTADWLAHGPALVRVAPLREVRLVDKEPYRGSNSGPYRGKFAWLFQDRDPEARDTPPGQLQGYFAGPDLGWVWYDTAEAALEDLSRACLTWARDQVTVQVDGRSGVDANGDLLLPEDL